MFTAKTKREGDHIFTIGEKTSDATFDTVDQGTEVTFSPNTKTDVFIFHQLVAALTKPIYWAFSGFTRGESVGVVMEPTRCVVNGIDLRPGEEIDMNDLHITISNGPKT